MIKRIFQKLREYLCSLRIRFIIVFLVAVVVGIGVYFLSHYISYDYIDGVYSSDENKKSREISYMSDLQTFVKNNAISSENTSKLSEWARKNKYVYLIIYKDDELFYTSDDIPKEEPEENPGQDPEDNPQENEQESPEENPEQDTEGDGENSGGSTDSDGDNFADGETEKEDGTADEGDKDSEDKTDKEPEDKNPGGVTIDYPTREELFEYATKNDLHPLELADGTMFASLTEFTEYLYYDISNIVSVTVALLFVLVILTSYFQMVTTRIIRLGNEVNKVAYGDVHHAIKSKGKDEISRLSVNVDNMRESMIENFEKERAAIDANNALITSMSHDIRTPLTVLLGYIDVMQNKTRGDAEMQGYLKAAESTAMRLKKLSDDMFGYFLVFSTRELEINKESYDAATLIDQMLFEHITLMRESGYRVEFEGLNYDSLRGAEILTDAQKLIRIFDNVFSNIYKYSDKDFAVTISVEEGVDLIAIRFNNAISESASRAESNGIGLKTCKKLGEYINAGFECESDEKTFTVALTLRLLRKNQ